MLEEFESCVVADQTPSGDLPTNSDSSHTPHNPNQEDPEGASYEKRERDEGNLGGLFLYLGIISTD